MIFALSGELAGVDEDRVRLRAGPMLYELLVPASDVAELRQALGREITFFTVFYFEGDAARGNLVPRLIGFQRPEDRQFFNVFTTVKGIGPRTALRALSSPVEQIAAAIENRDTRFLVGLSGIGKRTAELIIAELSGKVQKFTLAGPAGPRAAGGSGRQPDDEDALAAMVALGERRSDAQRLLEQVRQAQPNVKATDALVREMLRIRMVRT
jgi:Holliday junction DNA helicase RuvA